MRIIPAIDIIDGKCVRLSKGLYSKQKIYSNSPLEVAKKFESYGLEFLHLVDLDGAKSQSIMNYKVLEQIARETSLKVDFGGGIKSDEDVKIAFDSGASQVTVGSIAADNPRLFLSWLKKYGGEKIILGADVRKRRIAIHGWLKNTDFDMLDYISDFEKLGVQYVVCTDINKDGMLSGPSLNLYKQVLNRSTVELIASGGVTCLQDLEALKAIGCEGAIIGKAIYEGRISLKELTELC